MAQHARTARQPVVAAPAWSVMAEVKQILCPHCLRSNVPRAKFCQHCGRDVVLNNEPTGDGRHYRITRVVKQGGQGAVYEGIDDAGQIYAIKMMLDRFSDKRELAEAIERFNAEAEMLQGLKHPRIPRVYSHFTDEGRHYLTMDFVRGEDLEQIIEREGRVDEARALAWADQICDVLEHLHSNDLIYRDMKPSNVMIERDGGVKVVDFGIAKLFKPTERGTQIGTPGYAPPEQYQGLATPQSDVYALGATLHHLLTGRDPTEEKPFEFPPARSLVPSISQRTSDALARAVQFKADDRFASIAELRDALIPGRTAQPAQVRVAPATRRIEQPAAQVATAPAPVATAPAQTPAAPIPAAPAQAPATPQRPARPAPPRVRPARRGGFRAAVGALVRTVFTLALVAAVGLGAFIYLERPAWAEPYVARLLELLPGDAAPAPTSAPALPSTAVTYDLEVTLPEGADASAIREAFLAAFADRARAEYGPSTQVAMNRPPAYIGSPVESSRAAGQVTYRVTMQGYVFQP